MKSKIVELTFTKLSEHINISIPNNYDLNNSFNRISKRLEDCLNEYRVIIPDKYANKIVRIIAYLVVNKDVPMIQVRIKHSFRLSNTQQVQSDYNLAKIKDILADWVFYAMHGGEDES